MKTLALAGAIALALTGGAQVGQITAQDAQNAAAIDPADAACFNAIGAVATAVGNSKTTEPLSLIATKIAGKSPATVLAGFSLSRSRANAA